MNSIDFCVLDAYVCVEDAIKEIFGISQNQIKKYKFKKTFLSRSIDRRDRLLLPIDLVNYLQINPEYRGPNIEIISEDKNFLVLNKPYKIHMHPLSYTEKNNLLSFIQTQSPCLLNVNIDNYDRGLFYRLDYETSGIVYYAKNDIIYKQLRENFSSLIEEKNYVAIVSGKFNKNGEHHHFVKASGLKGYRILVFNEPSAHTVEVKLIVEFLEYNSSHHYSLVKISLSTGHRHQIRSQLAHLGFPILGDELYGGAQADRVFLHAYQYCFAIDGQKYEEKCLKASLFDRFFDLNAHF